MLTYAVSAGVEWVVLTDGNEYRIYNAHAAVPIEQKLFRLVRVTDESIPPATGRGSCRARTTGRLTTSIF